jgi:hypothetical protein
MPYPYPALFKKGFMMRKHKPCNENYMDKTFPSYTICQQLRELYHMTQNPEIKMGLRVAVSMAKAMQKKLQLYDKQWQKDFWDANEDH